MSKGFCLACLLFIMAVAAASAQEQAVVINNSTMNSTAALNNFTINITSNATSNESIIPTIVPAVMAEAETNGTLAAPIDATTSVSDTEIAAREENESAAVEDQFSPESAAPTAVAGSAGAKPGVLPLGGSNLITKPDKPIFAIGASSDLSGTFSIGKDYLPEQAYNAGMSARTIMDLSALPFYINHM